MTRHVIHLTIRFAVFKEVVWAHTESLSQLLNCPPSGLTASGF